MESGNAKVRLDKQTGIISFDHNQIPEFFSDMAHGSAVGELISQPEEEGAVKFVCTIGGTRKEVTVSADGNRFEYSWDGSPTSAKRTLAFNTEAILCRTSPRADGVALLRLGQPPRVPGAKEIFLPEIDVVVRLEGAVELVESEPGPDGPRFTVGAGHKFAIEVVPNYMKEVMGIRHYVPMSWSKFKEPVDGWCSWYYYYHDLTEEETLRNAQWMASNLKPYGAQCIQIDDCWQGTGKYGGDNRDWDTVSPGFPSGMKALADGIRELGMMPGIWLIPQTQSSATLYEQNKDMFVHTPDGKPFNGEWPGLYLIDATTEKGLAYIDKVIERLVDEGYDYFKIDGQPTIAEFYRNNNANLSKVSDDPLKNEPYRKTIDVIRKRIGPDRFLLGCYSIPLEAIGYVDGGRTGGDVVIGWKGFLTGLKATRRGLFLNNIAWRSDPDALMVRRPLSLDQARAWATLYALTGQHLMFSDKMYELEPERVDILKKILPTQRIFPVDLCRYEENPTAWALYNEGAALTVGLFNYDVTPSFASVDIEKLRPDTKDEMFAVYDFWNGHYLGNVDDTFAVPAPGTGCTTLVLRPVRIEPILLATGRHITQTNDLARVTEWDTRKRILTGTCSVIAGEIHELVIYVPSADAVGRSVELVVDHCRVSDAEVATTNKPPILRMKILSDMTGEVEWKVAFRTEKTRRPAPPRVRAPRVANVSYRSVEIGWEPVNGCDVYQVVRTSSDNPDESAVPVLVSGATLRDTSVEPGRRYVYSITAVDGDLVSEEATDLRVMTPKLPPMPPKPDIAICDVTPVSVEQGWGDLQIDKNVEGKPLSIGDQTFERGLGSHSQSTIVYDIPEGMGRFVAIVGVDGECRESVVSSVIFRVLVEGKPAFDSGVMYGNTPPIPIDVHIEDAKQITLVIDDAGDGNEADHGNWAEAGFIREEP